MFNRSKLFHTIRIIVLVLHVLKDLRIYERYARRYVYAYEGFEYIGEISVTQEGDRKR